MGLDMYFVNKSINGINRTMPSKNKRLRKEL